MRTIREYHHFKANLIHASDRVSRAERAAYDKLVRSGLSDCERESTVCWELKHYASTAQLARVLAWKRGLPTDICSLGMMLHDVASVVYGTYKDHAHRGAVIAVDFLKQVGGFTDGELDQIHRLIYHHSDKHLQSDDPIEEFGKDVDVLDCFLYQGAFDFYLAHKPLHVFSGYLSRARRIWKELGLPPDQRFDILEGYREGWFSLLSTVKHRDDVRAISGLVAEEVPVERRPPAFCLAQSAGGIGLLGHTTAWERYAGNMLEGHCELEAEAAAFLERLMLSGFTGSEESTEQCVHMNPSDMGACQEMWLFLLPAEVGSLRAALVWPALGVFEELSEGRSEHRLRELGVVLSARRR